MTRVYTPQMADQPIHNKPCRCGRPRQYVRQYVRNRPCGWRFLLTCGDPDCKKVSVVRPWKEWEREWAALMWARGLSCLWIGKMLRRLQGSVQQRLRADSSLIERPVRRIIPMKVLHSHGYVLLYMPDHPKANNSGRVYEHRVVAERRLGRRLLPRECVHHIDGDKTNNHPDNLEVINEAEHIRKYHNTSTWTPERDAVVIDDMRSGRVAQSTATALGVTVSAVRGRRNKLRQQGITNAKGKVGRRPDCYTSGGFDFAA